MKTMDRKFLFLAGAGIILTIVASLISIYAGGVVLVLVAVIAMSLFIMQDTKNLPDVVVELKENAKGIIIRNSGNADAVNVHVSLVPVNIEYSIQALAADQVNEYPLETMLSEAKAVATFENVMGSTFSRTYDLSARGSYDPLKPVIPLFRHK
ncbi:hypothetical protein [Methanoregula formicica]|uniref:Uncharacterized protein n=1 Tax=Methanoregula formicica (strain DSM 22288 / NBRC 105244 / SMSP) TaxID=593750 RepID=L0HIK4_METFS|nr:hypothetical protein [Methanoregula formicica]AGB02909.1 hypothetical protein Metfor_1888 [Methanoregula formicica SMSP]